MQKEVKLVLNMNNPKQKTTVFFVLIILCVLSVATVIYFVVAGVKFTQSAFKKKVEHIESLPPTPMFPSNVDCFYYTDNSYMCFSRYSIIIEDHTFKNIRLFDYVTIGDSIIKQPSSNILKIVKSE